MIKGDSEDIVLMRVVQFHGAARRGTLCRTQAERHAAARLADAGVLVRHADGVLAVPDADPRVVMCRRLHGVMACAHAMAAHGLPLQGSPGTLHVAVRGRRGQVPTGIGRTVVHRVPGLVIPEPTAPPVTELEQALLGYMRCASPLDSLIALDSALRTGYVDADQLRARLPGPRNAPLRALLDRVCPRARSLLETIARYELEEAGYEPYPGVTIEGVGEVDIVLAHGPLDLAPEPDGSVHLRTTDLEGILVVETDGYTYHHGREAWVTDHLRMQASDRAGHRTLRLVTEQVMAHRTVELVAPVAARLGIHPTGAGRT